MNCSTCGHENREGFKFCGACGSAQKQERACPTCNAANPPSMKFCGQCGTPLTAAGTAPPSPPTPQTPRLPSSFAGGRYAVRAFLGEGAKKRVYLAHDTRLDREVAFALIKTEGLDADGVVRIRREAQAMGRLGDHPHIVTVFDVGDENGGPYMVSQHMSGGSIEDLLARAESHRIPPEEAMRIGVQIADALAHAHARGIIHRDLKPGNIWLDAGGNASLGDFGLAIAIDRSRMTMHGMMVGTIAYMAPEQALGRPPDGRSDLYALGAMLYEMVAGRPPFLGGDAVGVISQHINTAPVAPSWHEPLVPTPLESLILRLLAKSPDERPGSAQDVARELRQILARSTVTEHPHGVADEVTDLRQLDWGRFVGRREEMAQLKTALENALSGKTAVAFLAGEPGIGKTRLAEEFAVYAELRGARVLTGRSYEGESTVPYRPFIEALRQYVRLQPDGDLRQQLGTGAPEIASMVSDVRQRFPDIQEAPRLEGDAERFRLFDSITTFLRNASDAQPIVLLLDDLHWVDRPSLLLVQHIVRHATNERLLVLATYRDVDLERTHPLSEALVGFRRMERFTRIPLRGLVQDEVYELLTSIESGEETAEGRSVLAAAIWRETEGNPFFIKEVLHHLVETGKLMHEHGRWTAGGLTVDDLGIPEGVREVIGRRLSRLSDSCNAALMRASAMTRGFTWEQFRAINASVPEGELLDVLDDALRSQIAHERKGESSVTYEFTHALIRQTLYEELSTPRRVLLHREIGEALESLYSGSRDAHVGELAYHFFHAAPGGDAPKAIDYCTRAGDRAADLNGHEDAIAHYERALELLGGAGNDSVRASLLLKLGEAQRKAGRQSGALNTYRGVAHIARDIHDSDLLAHAAVGFADAAISNYGDPALRPESVRMLEEALASLGVVSSPLRVRALAALVRAAPPAATTIALDEVGSGGISAWFGGRSEQHVRQAEEAVLVAREIGDPQLMAVALASLRGATWRPDNPEDRFRLSSAMRECANKAGDLSIEADAIVYQQIDLLDLGELGRFEENIQTLNTIAEKTRLPMVRWWAKMNAATRLLCIGPLNAADAAMMEALAVGQAANAPEAAVTFGGQLLTIRRAQGRANETIDLLREAVRTSPGSAVYRAALAERLAILGQREEAMALLSEFAATGFENIPRDGMWAITMDQLAWACFSCDEREAAKKLYAMLAPLADLFLALNAAIATGSMHGLLGLCAAMLERWDDAALHFESAIERDDERGYAVWAAYYRRYYADMLLRRNAPGDREQAFALLEQALDGARELNMAKVVEDCLALKVKAQGFDRSAMSLYTSIERVADAATSEHVQVWREAVAPDGTLTIMFSDIEDSAVLTERLGDRAWQELLRQHDALVRSCVEAYGGFVVKHLGDGFMLAFQSARKALDCAIAIQQTFAKAGALPEPVRVRIGLHAGEAVRENDDFFGKNVVMASRVAGQAKGGEILVSSVLRSLVESSVEGTVFGGAREVALKGLEGKHTVHAVRWKAAVNG